ncbi:hypothetical protein ACVR0O_03715, partial [Streptococcus caviae]|uniref:hypothetical protein n=1 Tax=Streptococcus sp. 'caviae' TaxID=1915004 RepID=UPI00094B993E
FHKILSNEMVSAFHYKSYGTFLVVKKPYNLQSGFTHYRNYRAKIRLVGLANSVLLLHRSSGASVPMNTAYWNTAYRVLTAQAKNIFLGI